MDLVATSIKIRDEDKDHLEVLQRRYSAITGRKMTLQEVLGLLIRKARIPLDELVGPMPEPTPERLERLARLRIPGKKRFSAKTIDEELYGWKAE